jgi:hypothetical protein
VAEVVFDHLVSFAMCDVSRSTRHCSRVRAAIDKPLDGIFDGVYVEVALGGWLQRSRSVPQLIFFLFSGSLANCDL